MGELKRDVMIRQMRRDEKKEVRRVMKRAFPFFMRLFYSLSKETFVAEKNGELLGGVVTKRFKLSSGKMGGYVAFIFTAPEAQGLGVGQALLDHALEYLQEQGCDEIFASVEGSNTSSSKMFLTRGFTLASAGFLIRRYRFKLAKIFWYTFHTFDLGHFLWIKTFDEYLEEYREHPLLQWSVNLALNTLFWTVAFALQGSVAPEGTTAIWTTVLISLGLLLAVRDLSTLAVSRILKLPLQYRLWETGLILSAGIALIFRGQFISAGSFYPTRKEWRYKDERPRLGKIALVSNLTTLVLLYGLLAMRYFLPLPRPLSFPIGMTLLAGSVLIVFDMLLPIFPFSPSNAGRIFKWSKPVWVLSALLGAGFILLREFLF